MPPRDASKITERLREKIVAVGGVPAKAAADATAGASIETKPEKKGPVPYSPEWWEFIDKAVKHSLPNTDDFGKVGTSFDNPKIVDSEEDMNHWLIQNSIKVMHRRPRRNGRTYYSVCYGISKKHYRDWLPNEKQKEWNEYYFKGSSEAFGRFMTALRASDRLPGHGDRMEYELPPIMRCYSCAAEFKDHREVIDCPCAEAAYCSAVCRSTDWKNEHRHECLWKKAPDEFKERLKKQKASARKRRELKMTIDKLTAPVAATPAGHMEHWATEVGAAVAATRAMDPVTTAPTVSDISAGMAALTVTAAAAAAPTLVRLCHDEPEGPAELKCKLCYRIAPFAEKKNATDASICVDCREKIDSRERNMREASARILKEYYETAPVATAAAAAAVTEPVTEAVVVCKLCKELRAPAKKTKETDGDVCLVCRDWMDARERHLLEASAKHAAIENVAPPEVKLDLAATKAAAVRVANEDIATQAAKYVNNERVGDNMIPIPIMDVAGLSQYLKKRNLRKVSARQARDHTKAIMINCDVTEIDKEGKDMDSRAFLRFIVDPVAAKVRLDAEEAELKIAAAAAAKEAELKTEEKKKETMPEVDAGPPPLLEDAEPRIMKGRGTVAPGGAPAAAADGGLSAAMERLRVRGPPNIAELARMGKLPGKHPRNPILMENEDQVREHVRAMGLTFMEASTRTVKGKEVIAVQAAKSDGDNFVVIYYQIRKATQQKIDAF